MRARELGAIAIVGIFAAVVFGAGQVMFGSGVRFTNAYRALEAADTTIRGREGERLTLANAMAESDPPIGLQPGPRVHKPGVLARLRYEAIGPDGRSIDQWEVRALVPRLPTIDDSMNAELPLVTRDGCPDECRAEVAHGAVLLERNGDPGIAAEWVLRMPLNQTFDLGSRPLTTQDLRDRTPRERPIRFERHGGRDVPSPAHIRITLVDACQARVRVGSVTHLQYAQFAPVPIPTGFRTVRWVQLEGCGPVEPYWNASANSPSASALPAPTPQPAAVVERAPEMKAPEMQAVLPRRNPATGFASLRVDESWLSRHGAPIEFVLQGICRYDPAADTWTRLPTTQRPGTVRITPSVERAAGERAVVELPSEVALFWVQWIERAEGDRSARNQSFRDALVSSGPVLCNDVDLGPVPAGRVPACVPFAKRAEARLVPAPRQICTR